MHFDLESFRRDKLKMKQSELAMLLGVRQDTISRIENKQKEQREQSGGDSSIGSDPTLIPLDLLIKLADKTGQTLDQLISYKKPGVDALRVDPTWANVDYMKHTIVDYISKFADSYTDAEGTNYIEKISDLQTTVNTTIRKPKVVFLGRSDAGKSTMINALIGKEKMPTSWTPTTSIIVYIKHIDDRPAYIEEELWLFKRGNVDNWDDTKLDDEAYCREWKLAGGSAEMLAAYGTQTGSEYSVDKVGSAVLFINSSILKNVDLVDVPGLTGLIESDDRMANNAKKLADVLVYLSQSNSFMQESDPAFLSDAIRTVGCPERKDDDRFAPLANIFVVATQAHIINNGNKDKVNEILDSAAVKFWNKLTDGFWAERSKISKIDYTKEDLRRRFFSYTTDIPDLRESFETDLRSLIEAMPFDVEAKATEILKAKVNGQKQVVDDYIALLKKRQEAKEKFDTLESEEPLRKARTNKKRDEIIETIRKCNASARSRFQKCYESIVDIDHIIDVIEQKKLQNNQGDMESLAAYISLELEDKLKDILNSESELLKEQIDAFIKDFSSSYEGKLNSFSTNQKFKGFDAARAFASGLAGLATFGGLAFWASTMGNLGGYILVAKGVSLLSALGISISGGVATATSAIAAIGGPVVLGAALAAIAALGAFAAFSGNWKKRVAKRLRDELLAKAPLSDYNNKVITKFWDDTEKAFESAAAKMEIEWVRYLNEMKTVLNSFDESIEICIEKSEQVKCFFENIPHLK